ncbi:MAG: beta-ketoacyl synthase N-terminal-like domain-containing protein [Acidobacteriota bacterium]
MSPEPENRRTEVVVTGLGLVGSEGIGPGPLAAALAAGRGARRPMGPFGPIPRRPNGPTHAATMTDEPLRRWVPPLVGRRMSPPSRFALAAARLALEDAGLEPSEAADPATGVALATSFGPMSFTQRLLDQVFDEGPEAASPFLFTECVANAPAAQVSIQCRLAGPNHTLCQREAGPLLALARGAQELRSGRAERMLVGVAEEVTPLIFAVLERFRALARPLPDLPEAARPFDRRRNGFTASEGAAVLVLESADAAASRGAIPRVRLAAWGSAFDPTAGQSGWGRGHGELAAAIARGLDRSGVPLSSIGRVVSGASGSRAGDRLEGRVLRALMEHHGLAAAVPILAPKGVTGEYGGGFLAAALLAGQGLASEDGRFPDSARGALAFGPTAGFERADPELAVTPHDGCALPPAGLTLVTSFAAGGAAAWSVLEAR